ARTIFGAAARRRARRDVRGRTAGAAVSQPARLRASDPVPGLRSSLPMPELHGLARRAPFHPTTPVPPLPAPRARAAILPGMPRRRRSRPLRAGGRTPARGSDGAVSGGPRRPDGQRSLVRPARRSRARPGDDRAALRFADRDPDRRQGPPFSDADPG